MDSSVDRKKLLPPYLEDFEVWQQLIESIDEVAKPAIDDPTAWLSQLRYLYIEASTAAEKITSNEMLSLADFEVPEKEILIKQANQMGFEFKDSDLITTEDYQRIVRNLALFWYSKGRPDFVDFLGFVLNTVIKIKTMWSNNAASYDSYGTMLPEGDSGIGSPIDQGGDWYPTTHVQLTFDPFSFQTPSFQKIINLFYAIANFNLVIHSLLYESSAYIHSIDSDTVGIAAVAYPMFVIEQTIETV